MLAIRLTRTGKIHEPHYRIVVQEKRSKLDGKAVDIIGHYHPIQADKLLVIDKEKATKWLSLGAQPSDTVTNLFVRDGIFDKSKKLSNFYKPKAKEEELTDAEVKAENAEAVAEVEEMIEDQPIETAGEASVVDSENTNEQV